MAYCSKSATVAPVKTETRVFLTPVAHRETTELRHAKGDDASEDNEHSKGYRKTKNQAPLRTEPPFGPGAHKEPGALVLQFTNNGSD